MRYRISPDPLSSATRWWSRCYTHESVWRAECLPRVTSQIRTPFHLQRAQVPHVLSCGPRPAFRTERKPPLSLSLPPLACVCLFAFVFFCRHERLPSREEMLVIFFGACRKHTGRDKRTINTGAYEIIVLFMFLCGNLKELKYCKTHYMCRWNVDTFISVIQRTLLFAFCPLVALPILNQESVPFLCSQRHKK